MRASAKRYRHSKLNQPCSPASTAVRDRHLIRTSSGTIFSPFEVEEVLQHHPAILDLLAFGVPDESQGDSVGVAIVLKPGCQRIGDAEIRNFARAQLAPSILPEFVFHVLDIPQGKRTWATRVYVATTLTSQVPFLKNSACHPPTHTDFEALIFEVLTEMGCLCNVSVRCTPFMNLGLDSISVMQLVQKLNSRLPHTYELHETAVFEHPTVAHLAAAIIAQRTREFPSTTCMDHGPAFKPTSSLTPRPRPIGISLTSSATLSPGGSDNSRMLDLVAVGGDAVSEAVMACETPFAAARHGGRVRGVELFDHRMFSFSDVEARATDPQQRLLLELGYAAIHMAGIRRAGLLDGEVGIYVGIMNADFCHLTKGDQPYLSSRSPYSFA